MKFDLLIRTAMLNRCPALMKSRLGYQGQKIAALRPNLSCSSADAVIDVEGRIVMPGHRLTCPCHRQRQMDRLFYDG